MSSPENDLTQSLLAECRRNEEKLEKIGADIRNKLSPMKTLVSLLREQKKQTDPIVKEKLQEYIEKSMDQSDISIDYLTKLL